MKKVWFFIWEEDSAISWIVNIILAFVIIKFLVYPGLGFVLGTPAPVVAVVSGSMEHQHNFDGFWSDESCCETNCRNKVVQSTYYDKLNISKTQFRSFPFVNGFNKGDIMFLYSPKNVDIGDVIVYQAAHRSDPIIHRVVKKIEDQGTIFYTTKGDNNCGVAPFEEKIPKEAVIGKAIFKIPFFGWVKIWFVDLVNLVR